MKVGLTSGLLVVLLAACTAPRENFVAARQGVIGDSREVGLLVLHEASDGLVPAVVRGNPFAEQVDVSNAVVAEALRLLGGFSPARFIRTPEAEEGAVSV